MNNIIRVEFQNLTDEELDVILSLRAKNNIQAFIWREGQGRFKLEETGSGYGIPNRTYDIGWEVK